MKKAGHKLLLLTAFAAVFLAVRYWQPILESTRISSSPYSQTTSNEDAQVLLTRNQTLSFWENKGQLDSESGIRFYLGISGLNMFFKDNGITYVWTRKTESDTTEASVYENEILSVEWLNANSSPIIRTIDPVVEERNYYNTDIPEGVTGVQGFQKLVYEEIYPHIDLIFYSREKKLKYDFLLKPGADPSNIKMKYEGQEEISWNKDGSLTITTRLGELIEGSPFTYQKGRNGPILVNSSYILKKDTISFSLSQYNENQSLFIDPSIEWATYYGASTNEVGTAVATDQAGNVFLAGYLDGAGGFGITTPFAHAELYQGGRSDALLVKFDNAGNRLWATYYGGAKEDAATGLATFNGSVVMVGYTDSNSGIAEEAFDDTLGEDNREGGTRFDRDAFIARFSEDGDRIWGTYFGGEEQIVTEMVQDVAEDVAFDHWGQIYVVGHTTSKQFIAHNGHDNSYNGNRDAFLAKFNLGGDRLWATYYGGSELDRGSGVATDDWGNVYISGYTESKHMAFNGFDLSYSEDQDAFLAKFDPNGTRLWATYYGDTGIDQGHDVATDGPYVYMSGITTSANFIAKDGHDLKYNGGIDAFLVQFNFLGHRLWGTYYGGLKDEGYKTGDNYDKSNFVCVSDLGDVYLVGSTRSDNNISQNGVDNTLSGTQDGYLVRFNNSGIRQWGSYYGGDKLDKIHACTTDPNNRLYVAGQTNSEDKIAHLGHDNQHDNAPGKISYDAFLAKLYPYGGNDDDKSGDFKGEDRRDRNGIFDEANLKIFPNPATERVRIQWNPGSETEYGIQIRDLQGKLLYQEEGKTAYLNSELNLIILLQAFTSSVFKAARKLYRKN